MKSSLVLVLSAVCLALPAFAGVDGGVNPETSTAAIATEGHLVLPVRPDGSGRAFTEAFGLGGWSADATITAVLRDFGNFPIANFPREDVWLQTADGGLVVCGGGYGVLPDGNSDGDGVVRWTSAPGAGGFGSGTYVFANGTALAMMPLDLTFVSPDINGDGQVNLSDGGLFTGFLYGAYTPRGDFNNDATINLSDVAAVAAGLGAGCP